MLNADGSRAAKTTSVQRFKRLLRRRPRLAAGSKRAKWLIRAFPVMTLWLMPIPVLASCRRRLPAEVRCIEIILPRQFSPK
jgi:hypothetical protein